MAGAPFPDSGCPLFYQTLARGLGARSHLGSPDCRYLDFVTALKPGSHGYPAAAAQLSAAAKAKTALRSLYLQSESPRRWSPAPHLAILNAADSEWLIPFFIEKSQIQCCFFDSW